MDSSERAHVQAESRDWESIAFLAKHQFGRSPTPGEYAVLAGAPSGAEVVVASAGVDILVEWLSHDYSAYAIRVLSCSDGVPTLVCDTLRVYDNVPRFREIMPSLLSAQLSVAQRVRLTRVVLKAEEPGAACPAFPWACYGFDAVIPDEVRRRLPAVLDGAVTVRPLMRSEAGKAWWRRRVPPTELTFDLRPGSESWSVFHNGVPDLPLAGLLSSGEEGTQQGVSSDVR